MQAMTEAPILARADGYLKRVADIGDRVKAGQVLAEIDAPELDQQIHQAEAAVEQAQAAIEQAQANLEQGKANRDLARITAERWKALAARASRRSRTAISPRRSWRRRTPTCRRSRRRFAQRSNLAAAKANLARLQEVQGYRMVRAPFDGVITLRNVDVGALVSTGSTLLYRIAQTRTLRTYVNVPQASVNSVHVGQPATLTVSHLPGRTFRGTVVRTANALDPATRTMLVEVDVPNADGALFPGTYAEVDLRPHAPTRRSCSRPMRLSSAPTAPRWPSFKPDRTCTCRRSPSGATTAIASRSCRVSPKGRRSSLRPATRRAKARRSFR